MTEPHHPLHIPGRVILREVVEAYQPYRDRIAERDTRVLIVRFTPGPGADDEWAARMQASEVSAQQKVRTFTALGAQVDSVALPDTVDAGELVDRIQAANDDPHVAAIIVQSPPPLRLRLMVERIIDPTKDIDALGVDSPRPACATADGIVRVADPFLTPDTTIAVVGARGFVGGGVDRLLRERGHDPLALDRGDDLRQLRDVDVVLSATGRPHLLTAEYLRDHLLVVDSGFVPHPDGPRGDVAPAAARTPAAITPVPGGIGPVEMAVLAERLTLTVAPDLASWRYLGTDASSERTTTAHQDVAAQRDPSTPRDLSRRPSADTDRGTPLDRVRTRHRPCESHPHPWRRGRPARDRALPARADARLATPTRHRTRRRGDPRPDPAARRRTRSARGRYRHPRKPPTTELLTRYLTATESQSPPADSTQFPSRVSVELQECPSSRPAASRKAGLRICQ